MRDPAGRPAVRNRHPASRSLSLVVASLAVVAATALAHGTSPAGEWWADADRDLAAMHDLIRENHPGQVDGQDPEFGNWLGAGPHALRAQADAARTEHDYRLVLMTYANGFADYHLDVRFDRPEPELWPGFLTRTGRIGGPSQVVLVEDAPGVAVGDVLADCGATSASELLDARVLRPRTNP